MKEEFIQYCWQYALFHAASLQTIDLEPVSIIERGKINTNQGADFLHATIEINQLKFVGSVEIHLKTSDWYTHKHHQDTKYNNVILHVVYEHDISEHTVQNAVGTSIPILCIKPYIHTNLVAQFYAIQNSKNEIPCTPVFKIPAAIHWKFFTERIVLERIEEKTTEIQAAHTNLTGDWAYLLLIEIAAALGLKENSEAMRALVRSIPYKLFIKYKDEPSKLEALLYGQSGILKQVDSFTERIEKEYQYLKQLHGLTPISTAHWNFFRLRPASFPTVRIAQLIELIPIILEHTIVLLQELDFAKIKKIFSVCAASYWDTHYQFGIETKPVSKKITTSRIELICINALIPIAHVYYTTHGKDASVIFELLHQISAEKNSIIEKYTSLKMPCHSAFDSQSMIALYKNYCSKKRCTSCAIGKEIFRIDS